MANEITWSEATWKAINDAVLSEMGKVRTAQKVFPSAHLENDPTQVPDEVINFQNLSIQEGQTKPFVELSATFTLTSTQVKQEPDQKACKTLARMAAKALALAEDTYFFQSSDDGQRVVPDPDATPPVLGYPPFPAGTRADNWRVGIDLGLLRAANPARQNPLPSNPQDPDPENTDPTRIVRLRQVDLAQPPNSNRALWGNNTFTRVVEAITFLVAKAQAGPYVLILPTKPYADTFVPPSPDSLVTTADRIKPLVEGGFYSSPVLRQYEGLLVALAGDPVNLFVGREAAADFVVRQGNNFVFRVVERVQYVVRDPRALVFLSFTQPAQAQPQGGPPGTGAEEEEGQANPAQYSNHAPS
jgi:uncharacterized linocin/CFP29 family protein